MTPPAVLVKPAPQQVESPAHARIMAPARAQLVEYSGVFVVAGQLLLLLLVMRSFSVAGPAWNVMKLVAASFVVHAVLPMKYRLPFFIAVGVGAVFQVLGLVGGVAVVGAGVVLIAICHLPVSWNARVGLLIAAGVLLASMRTGALPVPVSAAVWPILGSLFMFRLIVYMYDIKHDRAAATWSGALSYFFLVPNPIFPFFPVVDYKTFRRTYYDTDATSIYQKGVSWMLRGVVHLILYRFVYYYLTISPEDVQTSGQLVRFIVSNYGLYLRVSGTFHLIIGMLCLFGFNLPLSNNMYFLASSFTDYWRRVNIYWKDFMLKVFYYPSYFWLRRFGPTTALVLATAVVFVATTVLHSYQWFWLRGDWYLSPMDIAFWSALAVAVMVNVVWEAKKGRKRTLGVPKWTLKESGGRVLRTLVTFAILSTLWSLWSAPSVPEWLAMWSVWNVGSPVSAPVAALLLAALAAVMAGDYVRSSTGVGRRLAERMANGRLAASPWAVGVTLLFLLVIGDARTRQAFDSTLLLVVEDLQQERLNYADQGQLERGYYENLFAVEQTNPEVAKRYSEDQTGWVSLWKTDAVRETGDIRRIELVPSAQMLYKGQRFTTNSWGMRDRARTLEPAPDTYRFAVLGASTTMGSGVSDGEEYPMLLEQQFAAASMGSVEFLNFAVESYNAIEQVGVVDRRIVPFQPHALLYIAHETEFEKTLSGLAVMIEDRIDLEYDELREVVAESGVTRGMPRTIAMRRLGPYREAIVGWAYRKITADARAQGILPVWAFVPMPVPGTGPCPPGSAQLFCFGNLERPGAAADASDPRVQRLFELAKAAGFEIVDLSHVYGDTELTSLWISAADGHPNAAGHRLVADGLFAALQNHAVITQDLNRITRRSED